MKAAGHPVVGIGKIEDLFAGRGLTRAIHTTSDDHGMDVLEAELRHDAAGLCWRSISWTSTRSTATATMCRDTRPISSASMRAWPASCRGSSRRISSSSRPITATIRRRRRPITRASTCPCLIVGEAVRPASNIGTRSTFADLGQTLAEVFGRAAAAARHELSRRHPAIDSTLSRSPLMSSIREQLEARELEFLAPQAAKSAESRGRLRAGAAGSDPSRSFSAIATASFTRRRSGG